MDYYCPCCKKTLIQDSNGVQHAKSALCDDCGREVCEDCIDDKLMNGTVCKDCIEEA